MRIGVICDLHMGDGERGIQYAFLARAVEQMQKEGVEAVLDLGDITAFGELSAFEHYLEMMRPFKHFFVLGNADIRCEETRDVIFSHRQHPHFTVEGRTFVGFNTPSGVIEAQDRETLEALRDGDVVFFHHGIDGLEEESRAFMTAFLEKTSLIILHGHKHKQMEYEVGKSRVISLRGIDPDKAIGDWPTVTYLDVSPEDICVTHRSLALDRAVAEDLKKHMGISCVDNVRDVTYAVENGVKLIELRFNGKVFPPEPALADLVGAWRDRTDGYLSVHMPALGWKDGEIQGEARFWEALRQAKLLGADGLTVHVPSVSVAEMEKGSKAWCALLACYAELVGRADESMAIGIENLHMKRGEADNGDRGFGYAPAEVAEWIDAINEAVGQKRVGHVLDVGHARNNGILASKYPVGRWYEMMGDRTVAYHIHQTVREDGELKNHRPLEDWFGPMISYASFLYAWECKMISRVPVFLEVRGCDNFDKSIKAFDRVFGLR